MGAGQRGLEFTQGVFRLALKGVVGVGPDVSSNSTWGGG